MNTKKKSTEAGNFDAIPKLNQFLNSFNSNPKHLRFQCLNCDLKAKISKFTPAAFYDKSTNKMYVFRLCRDCRLSFSRMSQELKLEMCLNILKKIKTTEVRADVN